MTGKGSNSTVTGAALNQKSKTGATVLRRRRIEWKWMTAIAAILSVTVQELSGAIEMWIVQGKNAVFTAMTTIPVPAAEDTGDGSKAFSS